jgi:Na+-translocating ferredoxin:NAD+ oxidoreductase RnfC subunit
MGVAEKIREAGVVGAGGAGFPTHVKAGGKADIVLANGAECEPLLRVDRLMMQRYPQLVVKGLKAMMEATGARSGVICLKKKYHDAIDALQQAVEGEPDLRLFTMESYYPAGDEQELVFEVTGKVVPTGGIPLDVGAVVCNVSTLINVAKALDGIPVTDKAVTVGGEVRRPVTLNVPVGTPIRLLIEAAEGPADPEGYTVVIGGPATGKLCFDWDEPVTKTTGGVLVFPSCHPLIQKKTDQKEVDLKLAKAVCCQCNLCTLICPRNSLGLGVEPHKAMRAAFMSDGKLLGDYNGIFSCCDCGLCSYYACNFGLSPSRMMVRMKTGLRQNGVRPEKRIKGGVSNSYENTKVPTKRLMARMGITQFDAETPLEERGFSVSRVRIPLSMHIGAPSVPVVTCGERVEKGRLIAEIPEKSLGARIHASLDGTVTEITNSYIEICAQ